MKTKMVKVHISLIDEFVFVLDSKFSASADGMDFKKIYSLFGLLIFPLDEEIQEYLVLCY